MNGENGNGVSTVQQVVDGLTKQGYLLDLTVHRWHGQSRLTEADLGLEGLTDKQLHKLGRRQLVPAEEIAKLGLYEQRARQAVTQRSFEFPFGGARFVPVNVLGALLADLEVIRKEFVEAVADFCGRYESLSEETKRAWAENAQTLAQELKKGSEWLEAFRVRLQQAYPSRAEVEGSFGIEWSLYQIALPQGLHTKVIDADKALEAARLSEQARRQAEQKVSAFVGEAALELRQRAGELCRHVATQIQKSGEKVTEKSLQPLREMISQFKALDFTGDVEFAATLEKLQSDFLGAGKESGTAKQLRGSADYRQEVSRALSLVTDAALGDVEKAAQEALDRFLAHGSYGRAVAE